MHAHRLQVAYLKQRSCKQEFLDCIFRFPQTTTREISFWLFLVVLLLHISFFSSAPKRQQCARGWPGARERNGYIIAEDIGRGMRMRFRSRPALWNAQPYYQLRVKCSQIRLG